MSDTKETTTEQASENAEPQFSIEKIYLKDVSFESPDAPTIFTDDWSPEINMDLNSTGKPVDDKIFEVELNITVTAKNKDKTAFLVEIKQCGIFSISGMDEANLNGMLGSFCPNIYSHMLVKPFLIWFLKVVSLSYYLHRLTLMRFMLSTCKIIVVMKPLTRHDS